MTPCRVLLVDDEEELVYTLPELFVDSFYFLENFFVLRKLLRHFVFLCL